MKRVLLVILILISSGCATTPPSPEESPSPRRGFTQAQYEKWLDTLSDKQFEREMRRRQVELAIEQKRLRVRQLELESSANQFSFWETVHQAAKGFHEGWNQPLRYDEIDRDVNIDGNLRDFDRQREALDRELPL